MGIELRLPNIKGNDREQLAQIRSYLYQLTEQLQWALNNVNASSTNYVVQQLPSASSSHISTASTGGGFDIEIPLDSTMLLPRNQVKEGWNPDTLECGVHVVANNYALKQGDSVIMYNGVLIQMNGDVGGNVKIQLALPVDDGRNPMYRVCWYSNWTTWRSMKT